MFEEGTKVKVVDVLEEDAYYPNRNLLWGRTGVVKSVSKECETGFFTGLVSMDEPFTGTYEGEVHTDKIIYFYAVKLEEVK